ncbi:hypothetical protein ACHAXT_006154 [Thalassiosira profunda]
MPPSTIATPPPLPSTLSSRLRSSLDPTTGCCRHHPAVQLCELVQGGSRWVVRRKICYKCGARPKGGAGRHNRPGVSVANPHAKKEGNDKREGRRSRSVSVDRPGRSGRGAEADGRERRRSASHDRHGRRRSRSVDPRNNPLAASSHRLEAAGRGRRSSRELTKEGGKTERNPGRSRSRSNDAPEAGPEGKEKPRRGKDRRASKTRGSGGGSLHSRALEYTMKALEETADCRDPHLHAIANKPRNEQAPESQALVPAPPQEIIQAEEDGNFDESDPVIAIPALTFGEDGTPNLPPPPPRTSEEMERHRERLEMRRAHIRREREERRRRRASEKANVAAIPGVPLQAAEPKHAKQGKRQSAPAANLMPSAAALGGDHKKERTAKRHSALPSAAAMALLEGGTPAKIQDNGEAEPSTAVAALDATLARKSERKLQASDRRKSQSRRNRARSHDKVDKACDDGTETSELSFGTAKLWSPKTVGGGRGRMGGEHVRRHPELEGVALPAAPLDEDVPLTPPVDITVDRSRSASRSRQSGEDPPSGRTPSGRERTKTDPEQGRRASSRALVAREPTKEPKKERPKRRESSLALVQKANAAADQARHKAEARAPANESSKSTRRSAGRPAKDKTFHKSMPTLAASSARSSRRGSARGRVWDSNGNEVESKQVRTASRSVGNRSRARSEGGGGRAAPSKSASKQPTKDRPLGRKFAAAPSPAHSKDGRSRGTRSTHPESSSSDEWRSPSSPAPMVIRKARAAKKRPSLHLAELEDGTYAEKPFANISFHSGKESGDERSRTSSISAGSTVADETTVREYDDDGEEVGRGRSRSRAMDAFKGVQGGAKKLGTRSKSALGGWKGARRKWQSALFV